MSIEDAVGPILAAPPSVAPRWLVWDKLLGTYRAPALGALEYGFSERASQRFGEMLLCLDVNRSEAPIVRHD